jgi:hypothetical protein
VKRIAARVGAVTAGTVLFGVGVLGCGGGAGACEAGLGVAVAGVKVATADFAPAQEFPFYSHDEEVQANFMAALARYRCNCAACHATGAPRYESSKRPRAAED